MPSTSTAFPAGLRRARSVRSTIVTGSSRSTVADLDEGYEHGNSYCGHEIREQLLTWRIDVQGQAEMSMGGVLEAAQPDWEVALV